MSAPCLSIGPASGPEDTPDSEGNLGSEEYNLDFGSEEDSLGFDSVVGNLGFGSEEDSLGSEGDNFVAAFG